MKIKLHIIGAGLTLALYTMFSPLAQGAPASAEQLRSEVEAIMKGGDTNALQSLFNFDGVSKEMREMLIEGVTMGNRGMTVTNVKLAPLPADFATTNEINGVRYYLNEQVLGFIEAAFTNEGNSVSMQMPYGRCAKGYLLAGTIEEKIPGPVTKSKVFNIMVSGTAKRGTFSGTCLYQQGRQELKMPITESGNSFVGDDIESCTVQKTTDDAEPIRVKISVDDQTIFQSGEITNRTAIIYEKTKDAPSAGTPTNP